jgi:hypothetical protein
MRNATLRILVGAAILAAAAPAALADEIEVPSYAPPVSAAGPILGPIADRFDPTDVAAAPPPGGVFAPAPPAFDRFACDTFACGNGGRGLGVIESPTGPGELPGGNAGPGTLPGL